MKSKILAVISVLGIVLATMLFASTANAVPNVPKCNPAVQVCSGNGSLPGSSLGTSGVTQQNKSVAVYRYLESIVQDLDYQWSAFLVQNGFQEPRVAYHVIQPGQSFTTACIDETGQKLTVTSDHKNAFYCPVDIARGGDGLLIRGSLILPSETFYKMWFGDIVGRTSLVPGDFAAAVAVAHEFGHSVVQAIAWQRDIERPTGKNNELIADCLAGNWTASLGVRGQLKLQDTPVAIAALQAIGSDDHGSAQERTQAYMLGLQNQPTLCSKAYWK